MMKFKNEPEKSSKEEVKDMKLFPAAGAAQRKTADGA